MLSEADKKLFIATGAPTWRPRTAEGLVEAAVLCSTEDRYAYQLFTQVDGTRQDREFARLVRSGILQYIDKGVDSRRSPVGGTPRTVEFTLNGLDFVLDAVSQRLDRLEVVRNELIVLHAASQATE